MFPLLCTAITRSDYMIHNHLHGTDGKLSHQELASLYPLQVY